MTVSQVLDSVQTGKFRKLPDSRLESFARLLDAEDPTDDVQWALDDIYFELDLRAHGGF